MVTREEMEQIAREKEKTFIKISRVPINTKILFKQMAENEYEDDYGMFLKKILDDSIEYARVKECLLDKEYIKLLIELLQSMNSQNENKEKPVSERKTFADAAEQINRTKVNRMKGGLK